MERAVLRYQQVHEALQGKARLDRQLEGMGTTMTAALSLGDDLFVTQVGDSRAYRFRDGTLELLTRDQTYAQQLADEGHIDQRTSPTIGCATCSRAPWGGHRKMCALRSDGGSSPMAIDCCSVATA